MLGDNRHTRLVSLAKVLLPVAALALLSTLFLVSDKVDPTQVTTYSNIDVGKMVREQRLGAPKYAGVTEDGDALTVNATAAFPATGEDEGMSAKTLVGRLQGKDGMVTDMTADEGRMDQVAGLVKLIGHVVMITSTGYHVTSDAMKVWTDRSRVVSPGPVAGTGPMGTLNAGSMVLSRASPTAPYQLDFNDGVKLLYVPQK